VPDRSEHERLEAALFELQSINSVIERISRVRETNHIMSIIIGELIKLTDSSQGVINLITRQEKQDLQTVIRKMEPLANDIPFKVHNQISGWVLKNKQMLKIDDLDVDSRFEGISSESGRFRAILCFPMVAGGETIGLTTLVKDDEKEIFTEDQCRLAGIIVSQSAQILKNAILYDELAHKTALLEVSLKRLKDEIVRLQDEIGKSFAFENIIGKSKPMREVLTLVSKVCGNDSPVLITGQTGTGKELIARAIHYNSDRKNKPLVVKNCGVKTETLLESELFGHKRGSFTGADRDKPGLFKEANGGTIFLDEIGDAPLTVQAAILRVIESGEIRPIGSTKPEYVDVRVLSATNKNLESEISAGNFRRDLYYRLNTFIIELPPLKERKDDIPLLVEHFLERLKVKLGRENLAISPAAMEFLTSYSWPGNVRQLENELERAAVVCDDGMTIDAPDLSAIFVSPEAETEIYEGEQGAMKSAVEKVEREMICNALRKTSNNILQSAKLLGLTRKGLKDKMKRYGISAEGD
jgi:transcriptional regulator with GAF, ATPase, and Fis domain